MPNFPVTVTDRDVSIELAESVYPIAAIHGAAVIFIDRAHIRIERSGQGRARIILRPKQALATQEALAALGGSVLNELLHQALRVEVGNKTDKLRELVLGKAIMSAEQQMDAGVSFQEDPLGIARPWEESHLGEENGGRK